MSDISGVYCIELRFFTSTMLPSALFSQAAIHILDTGVFIVLPHCMALLFGHDAMLSSKALCVQRAYLYEMVELTGDFSEILTLLKDNPRGMSVTEIADAAHINRNTIARYMDNLLMAGRVEMRMFGKAKVFFLSKRVPVSAMLNLSSEMVLLTDSDLTVIQANEAVCSFLSCAENELVGLPIYEGRGCTLCGEILTEQIRTALRGETVRGELRLFKDGEEKTLDQRLYPLVLPDGKPGVTIILDDISERVRAETALEQSEAMFRRLVETVSDVIWSVDENAVIQYISPQIESLLGYNPAEMVGKQFSDFMPDGAGKRFTWGILSEISKDNGFSLTQFPLLTRDGEKIYCDFTGTPVVLEEDNSIFLGYNGALSDVSEHRIAEQSAKRWKLFLDAVIDNIPGLITVSDLNTHQFYYVNRAAEIFLKKGKPEFMQTTLMELLAKAGSDELLETVRTAASFHQTMQIKETVITVGGEEKHLSVQVIPMTLSVDREYLILIAEDITEEARDRKRQECLREFLLTLDGITAVSDLWSPVLSLLPKISGFEAAAVYQRSIFDDYLLFRQEGGRFVPSVEIDSIADRIIRKGETAFFDKHRMDLFPEGTIPLMSAARALVVIPVVFRGTAVACIVLGSSSPLSPDSALQSILESAAFQISTTASRCFVQEELMRERDRTRKYIELAGVFLAAVSRDGTIEMINRHGAEILGYREEDLVGKNWFETVVPESVRKSRLLAFQQMVSSVGTDDFAQYKGEVLCADGTEKEIFWRSSILREECGAVSGIVTSGELI
ncbi:MAG: PAS domain S-box protein [Methanocorpusculum parvum]|nr:PAS domain S-box protein [Methanocorpusculum parvum]